MKKVGTVALVVNKDGNQIELIDAFSDDQEIELLEKAFSDGEEDPIEMVYQLREKALKEDEEFGDYVEELLSYPFLSPQIQDHGLNWLRSKMKIEEYRKSEEEATQVIAEHALKIYQGDQSKTDFTLAGPTAQVKIRVFEVDSQAERGSDEEDTAA